MAMIGTAMALGWSTIGGMTIGSFAIGTVIQGAIVGAAIGGLTSAVMGGDIGQGMLYGAIGGAVLGGISGMGSLGSTATEVTALGGQQVTTVGGSSASQLAAAEAAMTKGIGAAGGGVTAAGSGAAGSGIGAGLFSNEMIAQGALQLGGSVLEGIGAEKQAEMGAEEAQKNREAEMAMLDKKLASAERQTAMSSGGGARTDNTAARLQYKLGTEQLAEDRRQYDEAAGEREERQARASGALRGARAARRGTLQGTPMSIEEQVFQESQGVYQEPQVAEEAYV